MTKHRLLIAAASAALLAAGPAVLAAQPSPANIHRESVRVIPRADLGKAIPGRFVVTLQPRVDPAALAREHGVTPDFIYTRVLNGFAGSIGEAARAGLLKDNRIVRIEPDMAVFATATANSWGPDRIDQRALPLNQQFVAPRTGRGVSVYVVDTGIRFDHQLFGGRAVPGIDVVGDGRNGGDCNGHGTHVAGTAGAASGYGVAPAARLVSARVLNCEGSGASSGVIAALDWIARNGSRPGVVNMSLGGGAHASTDDAVRRVIAAGFPVVVAAGNSNADACQSSPARVPEAITIGATGKADSRASFSNYGSCLDLFAPGEGIVSAWASAANALATASGTSMAAPHVAGAAALLLESGALGTQAVRDSIHQSATKSVVTAAASTNNHLLFVGSDSPASPSLSGGATITGTSGNDVVNRSTTVQGQPLATAEADDIRGLGGHDNLSGEGGNDTISGGDGTDTINGGPGNDRLDGGGGIDWVSYVGTPSAVSVKLASSAAQDTGGAGTDTLTGFENAIGSYYSDTIIGTGGNNTLVGSGGNDSLNGGGGNDILFGGLGNDSLTGGPGLDSFRFDSTLSSLANVDRITDFSVADDTIHLARSIFRALASTGTLPAAAFRTGVAAVDADDRIIHDPTTGRIHYDADGNGPTAQMTFAQVPAGLILTNADFIAY